MKQLLPVALIALGVIGAVPSAFAQTAPNAAKGQQVFKVQCGACHSVVPGKNQIGPSLAGVVGRKAGKQAGFQYSPAMAKAGFVWDKPRLAAFIAAPAKTVPGTRMPFAGLPDAGARQAVVEYLASVK